MHSQSIVSIVETRRGKVRGDRQAELHVFRGIPYAAPPLAALRFRPPEPPAPWPGVRSAERFGRPAPQRPGMLSTLLGISERGGAEDCLTLNIWTPGLDARRRPVMVWLHGGSFTSGASSWGVYDGAGLAQRGDVVVVTLNYRLGILGYLALPEFASEEGGVAGNFGLLDQIAALEWVRDEIEAFGGDRDRVTLFGQSAGAMSIGSLLGCPRARGLFHRAVLQSGAAHNASSPEQGERIARMVLEELGMGTPDLAALRALPVGEILAAQGRVFERRIPGLRGIRFQPVIDGTVLPRCPLEAIDAGAAAGVPLLVGTNREEYRMWALADSRLASLDDAALLRRCERNIPGRFADGSSHAERVIETYRRARAPRDEPAELWLAIEADRVFRYPAMRLLEAQEANATPSRGYLFAWSSPAMNGALGSCHALDVPFVFGRLGEGELAKIIGEDERTRTLSRRMQEAWVRFARDGDPNHADLPEWPVYERSQRAIQVLDSDPALVQRPAEEERRVWEEIL